MLHPELLTINIAGIFCTSIILLLGIFVLFKAHRKVSHILFFLLTISVVAYYIGHLLGINATNAISARNDFMFLLSDIFIVIFSIHFVYEVFGQKTIERKVVLYATYLIGMLLFVYFVINPEMFLGIPHSKLYLPYYYVPGPGFIIFNIFFLLCSLYNVYDLWRCYVGSNNIEKNRAKYMFIGFLYGYTLGSTAFLLVFDIPIDPVYAIFCGLYTIPFAYSFLSFELLDVRVVAKKAFLYSVGVVGVGIALIFVNSVNNFLVAHIKDFPPLLIPFLSGGVVVVLGILVWRKIREVDMLKYEFVTVITHKFRTPLTYIKWSMENLLVEKNTDEQRKKIIGEVQIACERLNSLTDLLVDLEKSESNKYAYQFKEQDISELLRHIVLNNMKQFEDKHIDLSTSYPDNPVFSMVDKERLEFALQIILDNAVLYTPNLGKISISLKVQGHEAKIIFRDRGIGIQKEDLPLIFTKFFRSHDAQNTDTEGMGIGLFIAKNIFKKHGGNIIAESEGKDLGSVFTITLPISK
ncbi:MAG: ATP-binding protein [Patescibacteria group bacterium]